MPKKEIINVETFAKGGNPLPPLAGCDDSLETWFSWSQVADGDAPCPTLSRRSWERVSTVPDRYEIYAILKPILKQRTQKPSTIYARRQTARRQLGSQSRIVSNRIAGLSKTRAGDLGRRSTVRSISKHLLYGAASIATRATSPSSTPVPVEQAWTELVGDIMSLSGLYRHS